MTIEEITQRIINDGNNPNDFTITILNDGYKIEAKASFEQRQVAKEEDAIIAEDLNATAEIVVYNAEDVAALADTLMVALAEITLLKTEIAKLKGGTI